MTGALVLVFGAAVFAQTDDYHKGEGFVGYSNNQVETGIADDIRSFNSTTNTFRDDFFDNRQSFNGVTASGVYNFNRYVGARGDFSANYKKYRFNLPTLGTSANEQGRVNASVYNFLGGVQVKDNSREGSRVRPFGHALIGVAHGRTELDNEFFSTRFCQQAGVDCRRGSSESDTGFGAAFGGGIDIKATNRLSVRALQIDYNPTHLNGRTQDNVRFGFGVVFR